MKKDKWITPDNYHFQDIVDNGRCIWCGKLATKTVVCRRSKNILACSESACADSIIELLDELS